MRKIGAKYPPFLGAKYSNERGEGEGEVNIEM
jgi:hypothetical protein